MFYNDLKEKAIKRLKSKESEYNKLGKKANEDTIDLYNTRKKAVSAIKNVEMYINTLKNTPYEFQKEISDVILSIHEFQEAMRIESENYADNIKGVSAAAGGTAAGGAIVALGPTAAMAIATTFGTASTGVAISSLSGAAAVNAALAWLGGGAIAAGGGGMVAGNAFLALAGPIGWGIAGVCIVGGGLFAMQKNKEAAEKADKLSKEIAYKIANLRPKLFKIQNLIYSTTNNIKLLSLDDFQDAPNNYNLFTEDLKKALASLISNTKSLGKLINERIE